MTKVDVRGRRLSKFSEKATKYTSSIDFDKPIAHHVVKTNLAHTLTLFEGGRIDREKASAILSALLELAGEPSVGRAVEDIHEAVEQHVVDAKGVAVAGYMNWGKSRNDQVATALRMAVREKLIELSESLLKLQTKLLELAQLHAKTVFPGYTHLQRAQLITLGHHFVAYFDYFYRCQERIHESYARVNLCPMGSAALAGSYLSLEREKLAKLLGFSGVVENSVDAVSSRDFALEAMFACVLVMLELSRLAEEIVLWSTREFGFVEVGDEFAASSSIMPHKKNPVVAETIRAKTSAVLGFFVAASTAIKALPYTYNLDFQEVTRALWPCFEDALASVDIMADMLGSLVFDLESIGRATRDEVFAATALAHMLTESGSVSFREAHLIVGRLVKMAEEQNLSFTECVEKHLQSVCTEILGRKVDLTYHPLAASMTPEGLISLIKTKGGANPQSVVEEVSSRHVFLEELGNWVSEVKAYLTQSEAQLSAKINEVLDGRR